MPLRKSARAACRSPHGGIRRPPSSVKVPERHLSGGAVQLVLFVECRCFALREPDAQRLVLDHPLVRLHDILGGLRTGEYQLRE